MEAPVILSIDYPTKGKFVLQKAIAKTFPNASFFSSQSLTEGFEIAKKLNPDVIISSVQVSDTPILDFCRKVGNTTETSNIPIVLVSSQLSPTDFIAECIDGGAADFITLPMGEQEFAARIRSAIRLFSVRFRRNCLENKPEQVITETLSAKSTHETTYSDAAEQAQQLAIAIDQVEESIVITDTEASILYVNPAFEKITKYSKEDVIGKNPSLLKSNTKYEDGFYEKLWKTISSGEVWKGTFVNRRKDGSHFNEEATISPVVNDKGDVTAYIAVKRDITQQMVLEQQLRQSQKMEAIGTLAGGIAHDFNNLLFAIIGYNNLTQRILGPNSPVLEHLNRLGVAAERAKDLVNQILTFSRQSEQVFKPLLVQPVIKEALNFLRSSIPSTIDVHRNISDEGGWIMGDLTQVHQIIVNLATNAYQAMKSQGGVLTVSLESQKIDSDSDSHLKDLLTGNYIVLTVSDTGVGMDSSVMERIFEPYFSTREKGEGTGLGLSIVHGIVSVYNGKIFVESELNKGTTFTVYLPELNPEAKNEMPEARSLDDPELRGSGRILVLDDETHIASMVQRSLEELGYSVDKLCDSTEALKVLTEDPGLYDLLITDMTMPKLTGADLAAEVLAANPAFPIVLCTGYSEKIDEAAAKKLGIKAFFLKPVSLIELAHSVKQCLAH